MRRLGTLLIGLVLTMSAFGSLGCESAEDRAREQQAAEQAKFKTAIEKALHEDSLTGAEPTTGHANAMRSVDLQECPPDFRVAYMKHIHAWDEKAAVHNAKVQVDAQEEDAAAAGALATLFDSSETPWNDHLQAEQELQKYENVASADVRSTFEEVEEVASKYGAKVPHS